ncbi:hypothetical protein QUA00_24775 [Microcoleus sp. T2B6]|uniref:hypothetical protein n=1 Tax=unclassified Microcoleus TaxID=2642155 RepID=UPI002FD1B900
MRPGLPEGASHLCSPPLEIGVLRQEAGGRRQEAGGRRQKERRRRKEPEEGRSQKKYFYKYEMLPCQKRNRIAAIAASKTILPTVASPIVQPRYIPQQQAIVNSINSTKFKRLMMVLLMFYKKVSESIQGSQTQKLWGAVVKCDNWGFRRASVGRSPAMPVAPC